LTIREYFAVSAAAEVVYRPNVRLQLKFCLIFLATAAVFALLWSTDNTPKAAMLLPIILICILFAMRGLLLIVRGAPHLTIGERGIVVRSAFRTRSASWDRLGAFTHVAHQTKLGVRTVSAAAPVLTTSGTPDRRTGTLTIPTGFSTP
jgi:hypothetical protein